MEFDVAFEEAQPESFCGLCNTWGPCEHDALADREDPVVLEIVGGQQVLPGIEGAASADYRSALTSEVVGRLQLVPLQAAKRSRR